MLSAEAVGLASGRTRSTSFGHLDELAEAARRSLAGGRHPLSVSWPGVGVVLDGELRSPEAAPRMDRSLCRAVGKACDGSDPVDPTESDLWPTPTARDYRSGKSSEATRSRNARPLSEVAAPDGFLNPDWVDRLMGQRAGWTKLEKPPGPQRKRNTKGY